MADTVDNLILDLLEWLGPNPPRVRRRGSSSKGPGYGYLWWVAHAGQLLADTMMPAGAFAAYGTRGQFLVVIPQLDRVIALLADPQRAGQESKHAAAHRRRLAHLVHHASDGLIPLASDRGPG